jgi:hypothetical protein
MAPRATARSTDKVAHPIERLSLCGLTQAILCVQHTALPTATRTNTKRQKTGALGAGPSRQQPRPYGEALSLARRGWPGLRPAMTDPSLVVIAGRRPGNPPRRLSPLRRVMTSGGWYNRDLRKPALETAIAARCRHDKKMG